MLSLVAILSILQQVGFTIAYYPQISSLIIHGDRDESISLVYYIIRIVSLLILSIVYFQQNTMLLFYTNFIGVAAELLIVYLVLKSRQHITCKKDACNYDYN
jgi:hypothetical protein